MSKQTEGQSAARRFGPAGVFFAALGLALFGYFVWKAGPEKIWAQIAALGAGFLAVLAVSAVRPAVRALAWTRCFESAHALGFREALRAYLVGDALGSLMPLGIVVSEPAKAAFVRDRVPLPSALAALAVENLFYMLSVALFIFAGTAAMLLSFPLPQRLRVASFATLSVVLLVLLIGCVAVRRKWRPLSGALRLVAGRGWGRRLAEGRGAKIAAIEDRVYGFYGRHGARFLPILALEGCFHLAGVAEVYATLYFILDTPPAFGELALAAFVLESVNRIINVIFKFVPMRVGIDEAGTGLFTKVLKFGTTVGVTLAIIRKARVIVWTAIGVAVLVRRGLSLRSIAREAQEATIAAAEVAAATDTERLRRTNAPDKRAVIIKEELIAPR